MQQAECSCQQGDKFQSTWNTSNPFIFKKEHPRALLSNENQGGGKKRTYKDCIFIYISSFLNSIFCFKLSEDMDDALDLSVSNPILLVYQTLSFLYIDASTRSPLWKKKKKKQLFPAAYYYFGCIIQTDTCSHAYDGTASCNRPAKIAHQSLQTWCNRKKATEVSRHRKHWVRAQIEEQLCVCIVMGFGYSEKYTGSAHNCCN